MPSDVNHPNTEAQPAWQSGNLSPRATAILERSGKGSERTLANNWSFSEESRDRVNEISRNYALSPEDQKRSDESNRRTAESIELAKKSAYPPSNQWDMMVGRTLTGTVPSGVAVPMTDRSTISGRFRPSSAGGDFALCLYHFDLARRAGGYAFVGLSRLCFKLPEPAIGSESQLKTLDATGQW
jgi:hypothetical protein